MITKYDRLALLEFKRIKIKGVGQGVGLSPFVNRLGNEFGMPGLFLNDQRGMTVETEGSSLSLKSFVRALTQCVPRLARIDSLTSASLHFQVKTKIYNEEELICA